MESVTAKATTMLEARRNAFRINAGDWLLENKSALFVCQSVLVSKFYEKWEEIHEQENHDPSMCCFLSELEDAIDLLAQTIAGLRNARFWPEENVSLNQTETETVEVSND